MDVGRSVLLRHTSAKIPCTWLDDLDVLLLLLLLSPPLDVKLCVYVFWWSQRSPRRRPTSMLSLLTENLMLLRNAG